jgi:hypothetical protein
VTVEEYAFQLEVALERERHVNASLHEQLISNSEHVDYLMRNGKDDDEELEDGEAPYTQAESELLAEHKDALQRQNASLLSDREQLIGQVSSLAAGKRCGTYPGCVHSITFVLTTLSQPNQARPIHSAASSKTRLAGAEVALVEIELKAVALTFVWAHSWRGWRTRRTRRWMCCGTTCTCLARRWRMRRKRPSTTWPRRSTTRQRRSTTTSRRVTCSTTLCSCKASRCV